jgi:hypothetical protein
VARGVPAAVATLMLAATSPAFGEFRGEVSLFAGLFPSRELAESRLRVFARYDRRLGRSWRMKASAYGEAGARGGAGGSVLLQPYEIYLERPGDKLDLRLGYSTLPWGVLDELQPTDRVNPLDVARFALENRSQARLPVPLLRARLRLPRGVWLEGVWVPRPRRGTFDQLDEATSPFHPSPDVVALARSDPPWTAGHMELGGRLEGAFSGWDWALAAYRDVADSDFYEVRADSSRPAAAVRAVRPARWMLGGHFETTLGAWTARGEGAVDFEDPRQVASPPAVARGRTFQGGLGMDRRVAETVFSANAIYTARSATASSAAGAEAPGRLDRQELALVFGLTRQVARATGELRIVAIWNTVARSGFARATYGRELVENLRLQALVGLFWGSGDDPFGLLHRSDFAAVRLRVYF